MTKTPLARWLVVLGCLSVFAMAIAAEPEPSGRVVISSKAMAVGVGVTRGDGTLVYQGQAYPFSVDGLSVADLGIASVTYRGEVFNLNNLSDFSGNYSAGEAGIAIAEGPSDLILKNQNGVVMRLHGTQKGARLTFAAQGVKLQLKSY